MNRRQWGASEHKSRGLSLIELMIALVLGLLITGALLQLYASSKLTYTVSDGLVRAQENARYALMLLNRDLRMAGSQPLCSGAPVEINNLVRADNAGDVGNILSARGLIGFDYAGTSSGNFAFPLDGGGNSGSNQWGNFQTDGLPPALVGRVLPGTDALGIAVVTPLGDDITGCNNNSSIQAALNVCDSTGSNTGHPIGMGEIALVVDCTAGVGDIFANNTPGSSGNQPLNNSAGINSSGIGNTGNNWSHDYRGNTEIYRSHVTYYFIGESAGSTAQRFRPALFRVRNCNNVNNCLFEELAEGVENMQLFFRRQGDDALYTARNFPAPWNRVSALEVDLVMVSPEEVDSLSLAQNLELGNGLNVTMEDRRLRVSYSNTIAVRNQLVVR